MTRQSKLIKRLEEMGFSKAKDFNLEQPQYTYYVTYDGCIELDNWNSPDYIFTSYKYNRDEGHSERFNEHVQLMFLKSHKYNSACSHGVMRDSVEFDSKHLNVTAAEFLKGMAKNKIRSIKLINV